MIIHSGLQPIESKLPVITFGIFDGVHRGHKQLLGHVKEMADRSGVQSAVITFWPHPRLMLGKADNDFRLLSTLNEKSRLIAETGIDHLLIVPFTVDFASIEPLEFIRGCVYDPFHPSRILVGDDVRFGAGGKGDINLLSEQGKSLGFEVTRFDSWLHNRKRISSTDIRYSLKTGDLASANEMLGYPYSLTGKVTTGNRIGNTIGFPTANIIVSETFKQIPSDGVYAVYASTGNRIYGGMLNIGIRPTIDDYNHRTIEVHMFGLVGDLYGESVEIRFVSRLRDEMKFSSLDELKTQLGLDRDAAKRILESY
ncbi:MAG: riboflavin biosynthesis protein RibF [Bacteroidota bacterium]